MLGYRKRSFSFAFDFLQDLNENLENFESLRKLQQLLIREIVRTEKKIPQLKSELHAIQATGGATASKRTAYLKHRIEGYRQCAYVWRCFGDAIAFLYMVPVPGHCTIRSLSRALADHDLRSDKGFANSSAARLWHA
jgi:hypothetical protein